MGWLKARAPYGQDAGSEFRRSNIRDSSRSQGFGRRPTERSTRSSDSKAVCIRLSRARLVLSSASANTNKAVFASMKVVEVRVRNLAGLGNEVIGVEFTNKSFGNAGPLTGSREPPVDNNNADGTYSAGSLPAASFAIPPATARSTTTMWPRQQRQSRQRACSCVSSTASKSACALRQRSVQRPERHCFVSGPSREKIQPSGALQVRCVRLDP